MSDEVAAKIHKQFSKFPKRTYVKGQILIFAGESPEYIFYITKGRVRKYDVSYRGDEVIVNVFKPPAFFPMSWALNRTPNKYFYKTEEDSEVHIVPVEVAYNFITSNPDVMLDLLKRVYSGMEGLLGRVVHLMTASAKSRLIYELIIECRRFGKKNVKGGYKLKTTEVEIAARSGLSRETVSREMHELKGDGLIKIEHGGMFVPDLVALEKAHGDEA